MLNVGERRRKNWEKNFISFPAKIFETQPKDGGKTEIHRVFAAHGLGLGLGGIIFAEMPLTSVLTPSISKCN